jgi:hypothetical protein
MSTLYDIAPKDSICGSVLRLALISYRDEILGLSVKYPETYRYDTTIKELDEVLLFIDTAKSVKIEITETHSF